MKDDLTKEVLYKHYITEDLSPTQIGRKYNLPDYVVTNRRRQWGIPAKTTRGGALDITGQRYGRLVALKRIAVRSSGKHLHSVWQCECDCGTMKDISLACLRSGGTKSCGCLKIDVLRAKGYKDISWTWWHHSLMRGARQRGIEFLIDMKYIWDLYEKQGRRCALTGLPIKFYPDSNRRYLRTASVDRIDSTKGYKPGNVQVTHKYANMMKSWLQECQFVALCNLVARERPMSHEDCVNNLPESAYKKA